MTTEFREVTLPSGLRIAAEVSPSAASAAVGMFVRTGTCDEPQELMGVSHFLEHMMFKGSATRTAAEVNEAFDNIGAQNNAFTSHDITAYHAHTIPEFALDALGLVADLLRPALRQEDFEQERQVILEEIAMYADNPLWTVYERVQDAYFQGHPLGFRVLGTPESIGALKLQSMRSYFTQRYAPSNTIVAAAGRIDFDALVDRASRETEAWTAHSKARAYPPLVPGSKTFQVEDHRATLAYMMFAWPGPDSKDPRRYAAALCAYILGGGTGSRLHWSLVEPGIALNASAENNGQDQAGQMLGSIVCAPEEMERAAEVFRGECAQLRDGIQEDDLQRARSMVATAVAMAAESPAGLMRRLGSQLSSTGQYRSLKEELALLQGLQIKDLRQLLDEFRPIPLVEGRVVPVTAA